MSIPAAQAPPSHGKGVPVWVADETAIQSKVKITFFLGDHLPSYFFLFEVGLQQTLLSVTLGWDKCPAFALTTDRTHGARHVSRRAC